MAESPTPDAVPDEEINLAVSDEPLPGEKPLPPPPPELVFKEVVLSQSRTSIPPWLLMATGIALGLAAICAIGLLGGLRELGKVRRDLKGSQAQVQQLEVQVRRQTELLQQMERALGGLQVDLRDLATEPSPLDADADFDGPAPAEDEEQRPPRGRIVPGLPGGSVPGGWWSGGF
ncbi:MAG: hypothetical protein GEEBNDBF_00958 [bacterium]|nr:hypothetical protein [bacterium]